MAYQKLQPTRAASVTPSDIENIVAPNGGDITGCILYVGTGGNIRVLTVGGDDILLLNVASASIIPLQVVKVFSTNTTASAIVAMW